MNASYGVFYGTCNEETMVGLGVVRDKARATNFHVVIDGAVIMVG